MSALTSPVLINSNRAYWLSSIANDVTHSTITTQEIDANLARFSTVFVSDQLTTSSLTASSFSLKALDLSEGYVSTLFTNNIFTSSQTWASDLSGGVGFVRVQTDPSGVRVSGDPIVFGDLVYFTSTITIVPVSTIVNTDILSANGFFSTLSSGSISAGQIQANTASLSTLTVSSITTTDISGFEPETWSLYPTLNSSITFQPGNVLSNVGNKLYFAGNEITDLSGGGANWSAFPAQQDVSMNNFSLRALSTLQYNDGARLYSQTGNNLFYNGQPIYYGNQGNAANWSFYPASTNVVMTNYGLTSASRLPLAAPQFSTVVDQGTNIASVASYDITAQNGNRGQINMTANGGFNNGIFGSINLTANGASLGGVGTGGLITLTANTPLGSACNASSAIKFSAAGIDSYAGAVPPIGSLAGYNFIYGTGGVNIASGLPAAFPNIPLTTYLYGTAGVTTESTFYVPEILPYWNGITTPPDLVISGRYIAPNLAQVYLQLSNVKLLSMDNQATINNARVLNFSNATGQITNLSTINGIPLNQIQNQSNIVASNVTATISVNTAVVNTQSTITNTLFVSQQEQVSTILWNFALGVSSVFNNILVNNIKIADDLTGVTNAPNPNQSRLLNFSTVNSFNVSTTDLWVSSINGASPGGGGGGGTINSFSTLITSSFQVSSMSGFLSFPIKLQSFLQFVYPGAGAIDNLQQININSDFIPNLTMRASTIDIVANNVLIGAGISTQKIQTSTIQTSSIFVSSAITQYCQVSTLAGEGGLPIRLNNTLEFISNNGINNVATINTNPLTVPVLALQGSTIQLNAANTRTVSFSSIGVSTSGLNFSSAVCYASNINFNYPLILEQDTALNTSTAGVAMKIIGHDFQTGAVQHQLIMGYRAFDGANFITAVWPGQGLEDLTIEGYPVSMNDGTLSTIFGGPTGYAVQTQQRVQLAGDTIITPGILSTPSILVSSINGYAAGPAFTNNLMLSTMELYAASTTLMYWDSVTTSDNINSSGYDAVVGINGNYKIGASFQFVSGGATDEVEFFILKNDAVISQSGGIIELQNNAELVTYVESIEPLINGDKIQIGCYTANSNVFVSTINGNVIQSPAVILTMYKVDS
jgi:hypothetical protein